MPEFSNPKRRKKPIKRQEKRPAVKKDKPVYKSPDPATNRQLRQAQAARPAKKSQSAKSARQQSTTTSRKNSRAYRPRRRSRNLTIYYVMFALVALVVFVWLSLTILFPVNTVTVKGNDRYSEEQILALADVKTGENLLRYNTSGIDTTIFDNLYYVEEVIVRKKLPGKIEITVTEGQAVACVKEGFLYYLFTEGGRIVEETRLKPRDVPLFVGYEQAEGIALGGYISSEVERKNALVNEAVAAIGYAELEDVISVDISDYFDIRINFADRIEVVCGAPSELVLKVFTAAELIRSHIDQDAKGTLWVTTPEVPRFRTALEGEYDLPSIAPPVLPEEENSAEESGEESTAEQG